MAFIEQIDGPLPSNEKIVDSSSEALARYMVHQVCRYVWGMYDQEVLKDINHERVDESLRLPRIASWVEDRDQYFGYAFAISSAKHIKDTIADFETETIFMKVNLNPGERKIIELKTININTTDDKPETIKNIANEFSHEDLRFSIAMLGKLTLSLSDESYLSSLDSGVMIGIGNTFMDQIADQQREAKLQKLLKPLT